MNKTFLSPLELSDNLLHHSENLNLSQKLFDCCHAFSLLEERMVTSTTSISIDYCFTTWDISSDCRYTDDMELDDAVHTAILTLKEG